MNNSLRPPDAFLAPLVRPTNGAPTSTAILLPDAVAAYCRASGLRVLVGRVGEAPLRRALRPLGDGQFGLSVGRAFLRDVGSAVGDVVEVELDYDADPDAVVVPRELASQLAVHPSARSVFDALSVTEQRSACMRVERGPTAAVRARRTIAAVGALLGRV